MGDLILVRGVPGCGKTTIADMLSSCGRSVLFCTDDMFMVPGCEERSDGDMIEHDCTGPGGYQFNPSKLSEYHAATVGKVKDSMIDEKYDDECFHSYDTIIVHNTFTQKWEMDPYLELAKEYDWKVHTIIVENRHGSKSIHGVPEEAIDRMKERFEIIL